MGSTVDNPISDKITGAVVECLTPSGRVLDVGLTYAGGAVRLGLEVLVSHEVDDQKQAALGDLAWIEIEASQVEDAATWPATRVGGQVSRINCSRWKREPKAPIQLGVGDQRPRSGSLAA